MYEGNEITNQNRYRRRKITLIRTDEGNVAIHARGKDVEGTNHPYTLQVGCGQHMANGQ
jgi:hypothetical protein